MAKSFYPNLASIIKVDQLPEQLQFIEDGLQNMLEKVYYKQLQFVKSKDGSQGYYSITLVTNEPLKLDIFDSGMAIIVNPGGAGETLIPLTLNYNWPVLGLIKNFNLQDFSYLPEEVQDIMNSSLSLSDSELIKTSVETFEGSGELAAFVALVDKINAAYSLTGIDEIGYPAIDEPIKMADKIRREIETNAVILDEINDVISQIYIESTDSQTYEEKLDELARSINGESVLEYIKKIIIPKIDASLELSIGLSFPRNILTPLVAVAGEPLPEPEQSILIFSAGTLLFSTQGGIGFEEEMSVSLNHPSQIGNTGLGIDITGVKLDLSRTKNIPEATLDGRPDDFQGVFVQRVGVTLPSKWFKNQVAGSTAEIFGNNLLIGTGGISGTLGLEAVGGNDILWADIGDNGFRVGFESFDIQFKQNKVLSSNIKGAMEIPKFVYPAGTPNAGDPVTIGIEGHIHDNGDFNLTASTEPPYPIELKDVFIYHIKSLELGREEDDFYIGTSGNIEFQGFLKDTLKLKAIDIERLRIYSDGTIEFQGGSIALVEPIVLALGPVEITVSAIHYGSHQKEVNGVMRKFNYFGFDGGISVDPLGVEIRGDGVKFYYCTDADAHPTLDVPKPYLHIQTLHLDLTIPASTPVAIINGWLSIPEPGESKEYAGGIKLQLPQAKISGSADMKLMPKYPAFIIDASIELPAPIPLGPVGIFGFRGLIGYRYVAEKEAAGLVSGVDSWYDYYKKPPRGIHVTKFNGPDRTTVAGTPFSIGAGASLGTSADNGTILNIKAMVLLSIPSLFMIDGRAAILSVRLGLDDTGDPPFFAFIAIGDNSLELGFGADFKMPSSSGDILKLYADVQAGFFFNDSSKWYVNVGTKTNPVTARVLTLLTITSYVMLSAKGIEAGARGEFNFYRKYGPIKVHAWAYIEVGGKISFEKPQFGAYMAAGVGADIDIKIVSLYAAFDILFGVEAPKPFLIYGEFRYCVKIKIAWIFKFKFCGNLSVSWEFNSSVDRSPIDPMLNPANAATIGDVVKGVNMLSNETFELAYLGANAPSALTSSITDKIIPLDTYIDIKTEKGLIPGAIANIIGGVNNPPIRYSENVPPEKIINGKEVRQVTHQYSVESIELKSWNSVTSSWEDYHPHKALYPSDPTLDTLKIGQFQKTDGQYSTIRLLATTPFSYTEQGQPGWYIPEQYGITPASLFCEGEKEVHECANFLEKPLGHEYYCYDENHLFYANQVAFFLYNKTDEEYGLIVDEVNPFGLAQSLRFNNSNTLQIRLPQPSVDVNLKLSTFSQGVKIRYYASLIDDTTSHVQYGNPNSLAVDPNAPFEIYVSAASLNSVVTYNHPEWLAVTRIEILPQYPNSAEIELFQEQIAAIQHNNNLIELGLIEGEIQSTTELEIKLERLIDVGCDLISGGDVALEGCSEEALCALLVEMKKTELCFTIDKVADWTPIADCAHQFLDTLTLFEEKNPKCVFNKEFEKLKGLLATFMSKPSYDTFGPMHKEFLRVLAILKKSTDCEGGCNKDKELCAVWDRIFDIRNSCLPHPDQSNSKLYGQYLECFEEVLSILKSISGLPVWEEISPKISDIYAFMKSPSAVNYAIAWEALQCIMAIIAEAGNCNCDAEDRKCYTLLHGVCWLSFEAYQFNINIPGQAAIEADALATVAGITQYIQPVWRPDTSYYVRFVLKDVVDNDVAGATSYPFTYGFSTGGPVGFFHTHEKATYGDFIDGSGNTVEDANGIVRNPSGTIIPQVPPLTPHPEKYALTGLRQYIDYKRSYPNADGNLLSAKPLFYNDETTKIDLFFAKAYAIHFFQNWQAYNGQASVDGRIKIVIKDPREGDTIVNPPYLDYDPLDTIHTNIPQTIESWQDDPDPLLPHVFDQYASLIEANDCIVTGGDTIIPKASYLTVVPKHLKPLKLYTAIVNNLYDLDKDGSFNEQETREVHKFLFQTSRYATFKEQVNSYILSDNDPLSPTTRPAVFEIKKGFTTAEVQAAFDTIQGNANVMSDGLVVDYQHAYDRIVEGILGFTPIDESISTEFNVVKDTNDSDKIIAIIIRNPEPFNNPKLPISEVLDTIQVLNNAGNQDTAYRILFSKDYSQAIIMHTSLEITPGLFDFKFQYKIWSGSAYVVPDVPLYSSSEVGTVLIENLDVQ